jgi:hypothetical protein
MLLSYVPLFGRISEWAGANRRAQSILALGASRNDIQRSEARSLQSSLCQAEVDRPQANADEQGQSRINLRQRA